MRTPGLDNHSLLGKFEIFYTYIMYLSYRTDIERLEIEKKIRREHRLGGQNFCVFMHGAWTHKLKYRSP